MGVVVALPLNNSYIATYPNRSQRSMVSINLFFESDVEVSVRYT